MTLIQPTPKRINALRVRIILIIATILFSAGLLATGAINAETASYILGATALCATTFRPASQRDCRHPEHGQHQI